MKGHDMKQVMLAVAVLMAVFTSATRAEVAWSEDFADASSTAAEQGKYMLLNFTGSDWCGWCIKLDKEVFSQEAYEQFASENLVSVKLDFPRRKQLSPGVVAQNDQLQQKYGIRGFPTIIILSPEGDLVQQTGYRPGGPDAYIEYLQEVIAQHKGE
jgi:protein disulfide-isomerase